MIHKIIIVLYFLILIVFCSQVNAHWIFATHEYMLSPLATEALVRDGKTAYLSLLKRDAVLKGEKRSFLDFVIQGIRDADLRLNGIFAIDGHCKNPAEATCLEKDKIYNDFPEWIIGDHGYNYDKKWGFYANPLDPLLNDRIEAMIGEKFHDSRVEILKKALGCDREDEFCFRNRLEELAFKSNAVTMAQFFWAKALDEWELGHEGQAAVHLGVCIHLAQDLTVPFHARLIRSARHNDYERYVWESYLRKGNRQTQLQPSDLWAEQPAEIVENIAYRAAHRSYDPKISSAESVEEGVRAAAHIVIAFFDTVSSKQEKAGLRQIIMPLGEETYYNLCAYLHKSWEQVETAWRNIEKVLKRRYEKIPVLVELIKRYYAPEEWVFTEIEKAYLAYQLAQTPKEKILAMIRVEDTLLKLGTFTENFPSLRANEVFMRLQDYFAGTKHRILIEREKYNKLLNAFLLMIHSDEVKGIAKYCNINYEQYEIYPIGISLSGYGTSR